MAPHSVRPHSNVRICPDVGSILSDVRTDSAPVTNEWAEYSCAAHRTEGSRLGEDCTFSRQLPSQLIDQQLVVMMMMRNQEPEPQRAGDMKMETFHPPPDRRAGPVGIFVGGVQGRILKYREGFTRLVAKIRRRAETIRSRTGSDEIPTFQSRSSYGRAKGSSFNLNRNGMACTSSYGVMSSLGSQTKKRRGYGNPMRTVGPSAGGFARHGVSSNIQMRAETSLIAARKLSGFLSYWCGNAAEPCKLVRSAPRDFCSDTERR